MNVQGINLITILFVRNRKINKTKNSSSTLFIYLLLQQKIDNDNDDNDITHFAMKITKLVKEKRLKILIF